MSHATGPDGRSPVTDPGSAGSSRPPLSPARPPSRQPEPRRGTSPRAAKLLVIGLALLFLVSAAAFIVSATNPRPAPSAPPAPPSLAPASPAAMQEIQVALAPTPPPTIAPVVTAASPAPSESVAPSASPSGAPSASPGASGDPLLAGDLPTDVDPAAIVELRMPIVPVEGFWGTETSIAKDALIAALTGKPGSWDRVIVPADDRAAIEAALGITIAGSVQSATPAQIEKAVRRKGTLGLLRASDVTYRVRAIGIGAADLFGNERVRRQDQWPLVATVMGEAGSAWDQKALWTLAAGGDSFTDRGVYDRVILRGKGVDYQFSGGTARVTGHYCCGPYVTPGHPVPRYVLGGPKGGMLSLVKDADLAIANHEQPAPDNWDFHRHGFIFSGKPELTKSFTNAGIDWMSLANNHIKDYGSDGVVSTVENLTGYGLKVGGAGGNVRQARKFDVMTVNGVRIAIIPCVAIAPWSWATRTDGGATPCKNRYIVKDIRKAKERADVVIVFPHWGVEYDRDPLPSQRKLAAQWIAAGADLILGAHSHVSGAIEEIDGAPVFYSLGNFAFDQNWATYTMESFLLEATWDGDRIVQMRLHPFLLHDQAQLNLLDPAKDDGAALLKAVRRVSFIDW